MSKFSLNVDDKIELRFRVAAQKKFGMKRGNITKALEEAMSDFAVKIEKSKG